jgi:hypothetical protein
MAYPHNTIAGRAKRLGKEIGDSWMKFFDWAEALELAHEQRTGARLKPDDPFSEADERMAERIMKSREPDAVQ